MYTQDDLLALKQALVTGASSVTISGPTGSRTITYRSKDELLELIRMVEDKLNGTQESLTDNSTVIVSGFDKKGKCR